MTASPDAAAAAAQPVLPISLLANNRLSAWLRISPLGYVEIFTGKVELGQGILTALSQIAAEELDLDTAQVRMVPASTAGSPNEAVTSGSLSIQHSGAALRHVCAQARARYLEHVGVARGCAAHSLRVERGVFYRGNEVVGSYWEMADDALLDCLADTTISTKHPDAYRIVGRSQARTDITDKVFGRYRFIHDLQPEGMVHGRIIRPPSPSAELIEWRPGEVAAWEGVIAVLRDGSLAGVVATSEALAEGAAARLAALAIWRETADLPDENALPAWLQSLRSIDERKERGAGDPSLDVAATMRAAYSKPFIKHASIGPSCALAQAADGRLAVWSHSQGIYNLRRDLGLALGMPETDIVVNHVQGAGCYGHNGADDVAFDAAWLARHCPGRPVRVQWSRADELNWSPMGPAMAVGIEADLDARGHVIAWRHEVWSPGHGLRPGREATPTLLGSWYLESPFERLAAVDAPAAVGGGADRNAEPLYTFPHVALTFHRVRDVPMRTSSLRALGAYANVFAIESFMDELAANAGVDPIDYRLQQLSDPRAIAVLQAVAEQSQWQAPRAITPGEGRGRGVGFARYKNTGAYCAVVAEIEVGVRVCVRKLTIAVDVGLVINPDGVVQQIEGGAIQAASWALLEAARFDRTRMLGGGWEDYPIMRFPDIPEAEVRILDRPQSASLGSGEASLGPTAAAIGNALFDALGVRMRDLPLTPDRIAQAIQA